MVDKPFEKRIRWNGGSTIGLAGCGIWLFFVVILVGMDERKACKVNTIAFLHHPYATACGCHVAKWIK